MGKTATPYTNSHRRVCTHGHALLVGDWTKWPPGPDGAPSPPTTMLYKWPESRSRSPARLLYRVMTVHKMQREDKEKKGSGENGGGGEGECPDFRRPGLERRTRSALNSSRPTTPPHPPTSIAARALVRFFPAAGRGITPPSLSLSLSI